MTAETSNFWKHGFRYVLLVICFLCLTSINSNYLIINFTFICMGTDEDGIVHTDNGTYNRWDFSVDQQKTIHWALALGSILGTFPINWAYIKFGARYPFFIAGLCSVTSTLLLPTAVNLGMIFILICRFIQGVAYSADFAAIGIMMVRWAPLKETGLFISTMTIFTAVAPVVTNPISGIFCASPSLGWRYSYYFHGAFCALMFILWFVLYRDEPHLHRQVSSKELKIIQDGKTKNHYAKDSFVPYKEILKNKTILIVWFNAFVEMTSVTCIITFAPIYFSKVLQYSVSETGFLTAVTAGVHIPVKVCIGYISDKVKCCSEVIKMCFFNSIAVGFSGVCCLGIAFTPMEVRPISVILFGAVFASMAVNPGGFYKCGAFAARQYAHFVLATIQFMKCIALLVTPGIYALLVSDESSFEQWRGVYIINAVFLLLANFMFYFIATDKPAKFTEITRESREAKRQYKVDDIMNSLSTSTRL